MRKDGGRKDPEVNISTTRKSNTFSDLPSEHNRVRE